MRAWLVSGRPYLTTQLVCQSRLRKRWSLFFKEFRFENLVTIRHYLLGCDLTMEDWIIIRYGVAFSWRFPHGSLMKEASLQKFLLFQGRSIKIIVLKNYKTWHVNHFFHLIKLPVLHIQQPPKKGLSRLPSWEQHARAGMRYYNVQHRVPSSSCFVIARVKELFVNYRLRKTRAYTPRLIRGTSNFPARPPSTHEIESN